MCCPMQAQPAPRSESLLSSIPRLASKRGGGGVPASAAGTIPLATSGRVELCGRALLPPGVDDLVLAIFDDEPTSIIAYFLSTRCSSMTACHPCSWLRDF
jgi:hypothetical protein